MIALLDAYRAGLMNKQYWWSNLIAGTIVGVVALPLAMAFAIASGAKPEQGLYTAIVAALIVGLFGGSRVQIAGPTGAFIVLLAHITAQYGIAGLQVATLMAGILLILMGLFRLGTVVNHIPHAVLVGFTAGIGFIIFVGEWKDFFGLTLSLPLNAPFYKKFWLTLIALPTLHFTTTCIALFCLLTVVLTPYFTKRIPGPLIAMVGAIVLQKTFHFDVTTIGSTFGEIPNHLPSIHLPAISANGLRDLFMPAVTIALLGAIESLLSAKVADKLAGTRHHANQELIGQGLANMITPLFNGFAATGAIARTATNIRNGGNSPLAAVTHSILLVLIILYLAPLASEIPLSALAAILFVVAYNMSDIKLIQHMLRHSDRSEIIVLFTTLLLTIFTDLITAVMVGTLLSVGFYWLGDRVSIKRESPQPNTLSRRQPQQESQKN